MRIPGSRHTGTLVFAFRICVIYFRVLDSQFSFFSSPRLAARFNDLIILSSAMFHLKVTFSRSIVTSHRPICHLARSRLIMARLGMMSLARPVARSAPRLIGLDSLEFQTFSECQTPSGRKILRGGVMSCVVVCMPR